MDYSDLPDYVRDYKLETRFLQDSKIVHVELQEYWERDRQPIGRGGQGRVYVQRCTEGHRRGSQRAIKVIPHQDGGARRRYLNELQTLIKFSHDKFSKHFVKTLGWYESKNNLYIAMEYFPAGDLQTYLSQNSLSEDETRQIIMQVLQGLVTMHREGFAHRDIKPQNVLIHRHPTPTDPSPWWIKLADFGISKRLVAATQGTSTVVGTEEYMAPELFSRSSPSDIDYPATDIWALGVMAFFMFTNRCCFKNPRDIFRYEMSPDEHFPRPEMIERKISESGQSFVYDLMRPNPEGRPGSEAVRDHAWIKPCIPTERVISDTRSESSASLPYSSRSSFEERGWTTQVSQLSISQSAVEVARSIEPSPLTELKEPLSLLDAARDGYTNTCAALIDAGEELEQRDKDGDTPLLLAVRGSHEETVRLLLERGADVEAKNRFGDTAVSMTFVGERHGLMPILLERHRASAEQEGESHTRPAAVSDFIDTVGYIMPIGIVRFHVKRANNIPMPIVPTPLSAPSTSFFARVLCSGIEKARTSTISDDRHPEWNQTIYVPILTPYDQVDLSVMRCHETNDEGLRVGGIEFLVSDLVREANSDFAGEDTDKMQEVTLQGVVANRATLTYTATFHWCLDVTGPWDGEGKERVADAAGHGREDKSSLDTRSKIWLSPDELFQHQSGLLIFHITQTEMSEPGAQLEISLDRNARPAYISTRLIEGICQLNEYSDAVVRELQFSSLLLRVVKKGNKGTENLAQVRLNTFNTLKRCLHEPMRLRLRPNVAGTHKAPRIWISLRYLPITLKPDMSESIANTGTVRIELLNGTNIPSSGRSNDLYCQFEMNNMVVFTSKRCRKTVNPIWNEFFEVPVLSRMTADMVVKVFDYNYVNKHDFLGGAFVKFEHLEPFRTSVSSIQLNGKSGTVRLRLLFRPDYIPNVDQNSASPESAQGKETLTSAFKTLRAAMKQSR